MAPVLYERIDENNVRIGTKWFKNVRLCAWPIFRNPTYHEGVVIYYDGAKRFISNSWYLDEEIERL